MFTIHSDLAPDEAMMHIQTYMNSQQKNWTLAHKDKSSLTFTRTSKPNVLGVILLLFLWVLPGLLYLVFGWRKETCNIFVRKTKEGSKIVFEAGLMTKTYGKALAKQLSKYADDVEVEDETFIWSGDISVVALVGVVCLILAILALITLY
jgi:hypothetical protein